MTEIIALDKNMIPAYGQIPISFEVKSVLKITLLNNGLDGIRFSEEEIPTPYLKDYDENDHTPEHWPKRFNLDN